MSADTSTRIAEAIRHLQYTKKAIEALPLEARQKHEILEVIKGMLRTEEARQRRNMTSVGWTAKSETKRSKQ